MIILRRDNDTPELSSSVVNTLLTSYNLYVFVSTTTSIINENLLSTVVLSALTGVKPLSGTITYHKELLDTLSIPAINNSISPSGYVLNTCQVFALFSVISKSAELKKLTVGLVWPANQ